MRKKRRKIREKRNRILLFFCIFLIILLSYFLFSYFEKKLLPPLKEISHMQCKALANQIIDSAVESIIEDNNISTSPLLLKGEEGESYAANTALVNQFCSFLSSDITEDLSVLPKEVIRIPVGAASDLSFFANLGPKIPFTLIPMGAVKVDYETAFQSVGINQINYKIWLKISIDLKIVNPLYQETLAMERKIMLVDLIFSGKVPEHYFQMGQRDEYLLTE